VGGLIWTAIAAVEWLAPSGAGFWLILALWFPLVVGFGACAGYEVLRYRWEVMEGRFAATEPLRTR
jgi:hypothetical protein